MFCPRTLEGLVLPNLLGWTCSFTQACFAYIATQMQFFSSVSEEGKGIFSLPCAGRFCVVPLEAPPSTVEGGGLLCINLIP